MSRTLLPVGQLWPFVLTAASFSHKLFDNRKALHLPPQTVWVVIEGGNHAQFGWYGEQPGDGVARIPREIQQEQVIRATLDLMGQTTDP